MSTSLVSKTLFPLTKVAPERGKSQEKDATETSQAFEIIPSGASKQQHNTFKCIFTFWQEFPQNPDSWKAKLILSLQ